MAEVDHTTDLHEQAIANLHRLVQKHSTALSHGFLASDIGQHWKYEYPDQPWNSAFEKLSHLLGEYVKQHPEVALVNPGTPRQALRFAIGDGSTVTPPSNEASEPTNRSKIRFLRRDVYEALVFEGQRPLFVDPTRGIVTRESANGSVKLDQIGQDTQKRWGRDFMNEKGLGEDATLVACLDRQPWFSYFAHALEQRSADLARDWRAFRQARVVEFLENWCAKHKVPMGIFLPCARTEAQTGVDRHKSRERDAILQALNRMDTEALLDIPIPARLLFEEWNRDVNSAR